MAWEAEIADIAENRARRVSVKWSSVTGSRVLVRRWQDIRNGTEESAMRCLMTYACAANATAGTASQYVLNPLADNKQYIGVWRQVSLEEGRRLTGVDVQGVFQVLVECGPAQWFGIYTDRDGFGDTYQRTYMGTTVPYSAPEDVIGTVYGAAWQLDPQTGLYGGQMTERISEARQFEFAAQNAAGVADWSVAYRNRRGLFDAPASVQNNLYSASWDLQADRTYHGGYKQEHATPFAVTWTTPTFWGNAQFGLYRHYATPQLPAAWALGWDSDFDVDYNRFMSYDSRWAQTPGPYRFGLYDAGAGSYQFTEAERPAAVYMGWDAIQPAPASVQNLLYSDTWELDRRSGLYSGRVNAQYAYPNVFEWTEPGPWGDAARALYRFWPTVPAVPRWALEADIGFEPSYNRFGSYDLRWGRTPAAYQQGFGPLTQADGFFESSAVYPYHGWDFPPVLIPDWAQGAVYRASWQRDWRTGLYDGTVTGEYGKARSWAWSWATPWGTATQSAYRNQTDAVAPLADFRRWDSDATNEYGADGLYNSRFSAQPVPYEFDEGEFLRSVDAFSSSWSRPYVGMASRFDAPEGPPGTLYEVAWTMNRKTGTYDGVLGRQGSSASTIGTMRTYGYDGWAYAYDYRGHADAVHPDATWLAPGYEYVADWKLNPDKTYSGGLNLAYDRPRFFCEPIYNNWGTGWRGSYEAWPYDPQASLALPTSGLGYNTSVVTRERNGAYWVDWHAVPTAQKGGGSDDWANFTADPFTVYERKFIWVSGELLYGDMQLTKSVKQTTSATAAFGFVNGVLTVRAASKQLFALS